MPLGKYTKAEVREFAKLAGLTVAEKADSQDFYSGDINDILQNEPQEGNFVDRNGKVLGKHQGFWHYTVGQRRGMGISAEKPLYVIGINKDKNEVVLGFDDETLKGSLVCSNLAWMAISGINQPRKISARIRSSQIPTPATISMIENDKVLVEFENLQKAVAPGQSVVFYDNDIVLGGGIIDR